MLFADTALAQAAALTGTAPAASAATTDQPADDGDILVTARRQSESLIDVPVAVSALAPKDLARYNATNLQDIVKQIPQVFVAQVPSGTGYVFTIRGIGSPGIDAGLDQSVSANVDGIQLSRGRIAAQSFFDVQQVEVLKGPQALFFGKNSPAGVISITTAGPTEELAGYIRGGYEFRTDQRYVEAAIGGPIAQDLGVRLAVRADDQEGYIRNVATPRPYPFAAGQITPGASSKRLPAERNILARLTVKYQPAGDFDATLKVFGTRRRSNGYEVQDVLCSGDHPTVYGVPDTQNDCKLNFRIANSLLPLIQIQDFPLANPDNKPYSRTDAILSSLAMNYAIGDATLTAVSGFYHYKVVEHDQTCVNSFGICTGASGDRFTSFSQELRLVTNFDSPFNFSAGGLVEFNKRSAFVNATFLPLPIPDPGTNRWLHSISDNDNKGRTYTAFGQARYAITDQLELAGGVRWTREVKRVNYGNLYVNAIADSVVPGGLFLPEGLRVRGRFADDNFSPEATLTYKPSQDSTVYIAYKTGYKSGGFSNPSVISSNYIDINQAEFQPEKAKGGEVGFKARLLDRRLRVNLVGYVYQFDDLQLSSLNPTTVTFTIRNAAKAQTKGVELETNYDAGSGLSLRGAASYNRARYKNFSGAPCYNAQTTGCVNGSQDLTGEQLVRAPTWNFSGGATYETPIAGDLHLSLSGDARYTSSYWLQENVPPIARQGGYWLVDASVRLIEKAQGWELAVIGRNLTNERYGVASNDRPGVLANLPPEINVAMGLPRQISLQASFNF